MPDPDSLLYRRFGGDRPGLDLLGIEHVAIPVTVVNTDVLAQERKALPLLDEFMLRAVKASVGGPAEIAAFLGLDRTLVDTTAADLLRAGTLGYGHGPRDLVLTVRGRRAADELESIRPVQRKLAITFDRLTWSVADYQRQHLLTKRDACALGMVLLPARQTTRITPADITSTALNSLLSRAGRRGGSFEILDVLEVSPHTHRYMPARILVFSDQARGEIQAAVTVDGDLSAAHELALVELRGPAQLNLQAGEPAERPELPSDLESLRVPPAGLWDASAGKGQDGGPAGHAAASGARALRTDGTGPRVRGVELFEHHELLTTALETARDRILVISSVLTRSVVDPTFLSRLEQRLRDRVRVHLVLLGEDAAAQTERNALDEIRKTERKYRGRLEVLTSDLELPNTLIFDENWVASDFPWLSFRGSDRRTYRDYEGTLVTIPSEVDRVYDELLSVLGG